MTTAPLLFASEYVIIVATLDRELKLFSVSEQLFVLSLPDVP